MRTLFESNLTHSVLRVLRAASDPFAGTAGTAGTAGAAWSVPVDDLQRAILQRFPWKFDNKTLSNVLQRLWSNPSSPGLTGLNLTESASVVCSLLTSMLSHNALNDDLTIEVKNLEDVPGRVVSFVCTDRSYLINTINSNASRLGIRFGAFVSAVIGVRVGTDGSLNAIIDDPNAVEASASSARTDSVITLYIAVAHVIEVRGQNRLNEFTESMRSASHLLRLIKNDNRNLHYRIEDVREECLTNENRFQSQMQNVSSNWHEARAFLSWLSSENFIFIGYRKVMINPDTNVPAVSGQLGVFRQEDFKPTGGQFSGDNAVVPVSTGDFLREQDTVRVFKANIRSPVVIDRYLELVSVKIVPADGDGITGMGEHQFVGLFRSSVRAERVQDLPYYRQKIRRVIDRINSGGVRLSSTSRTLWEIANDYPTDEIWQAKESELEDAFRQILRLNTQRGVLVLARQDMQRRYVSVIVYFPANRYRPSVRQRIREILKSSLAISGELRAEYAYITDNELTWLFHFIIRPERDVLLENAALQEEIAQIRNKITLLAESWSDAASHAIDIKSVQTRFEALAGLGEGDWLGAFPAVEDALPTAYREQRPIHIAANIDIPLLLDAIRSQSVRCVLRELEPSEMIADGLAVATQADGASGASGASLPAPAVNPRRHVEIIAVDPVDRKRGHFPLASTLDILRNFGVTVDMMQSYRMPLSQLTDALGSKEAFSDATIAIFRLADHDPLPSNVDDRKLIEESLSVALDDNDTEQDALSRMSWSLAMPSKQVMFWRSLGRYMRLLNLPITKYAMALSLANNAQLTKMLMELFTLRFDVNTDKTQNEERLTKLQDQITQAISDLKTITDDRLFRCIHNLIMCTLRTNYFVIDNSGTQPLVLKFDTMSIEEAPHPRPLRELFVYHVDFEAIHLRGGMVARGGIRWSDRMEDFRTEILGLMKAQKVKNAVIVPTGAKGGFIIKKSMATEQMRKDAGRFYYEQFIAAILSVTDNIIEGKVVPVEGIARLDGDDPYLVVAADKGTATFSDYANAISLRRGFWLGDAFASGGSVGYDHKVMGITARGAWIAVQRHFFAKGLDPETQPISVIGVGDMAGDVFGNGMLRSKTMRLIGAFNHRHIFIDPQPDPVKSFEERLRLFKAANLTWADYDRALISEGGGVYERSSKSLTLSDQACERLGLKPKRLYTPNEVIRAMLCANVDLLWLGGIGTYVKAEDEANQDVGDRANDDLRISASMLRCKVVGEGANLGMTQRGRIEFVSRGGACNTDAIDNSAGVNSSDLEVNIKILLSEAIVRDALKPESRTDLLRSLQDDVARLVLQNNLEQTDCIAVEQSNGALLLDSHQNIIDDLERLGELDRKIEFLPSDQVLNERQRQGVGLTTPEISVVLAYVKNILKQRLLSDRNLPVDAFAAQVSSYFPPALSRDYAAILAHHPLRREIAVTSIINEIVNRWGPGAVFETLRLTGVSVCSLAYAHIIVRDAMGLKPLWDIIDEQRQLIAAEMFNRMVRETRVTLSRLGVWVVRNVDPVALNSPRTAAQYHQWCQLLLQSFDSIATPEAQLERAQRIERFSVEGFSTQASVLLGSLKVMSSVFDIGDICQKTNVDFVNVAKVYHYIGGAWSLDLIRTRANAMRSPQDPWQASALDQIIADLWQSQRRLTECFIKNPSLAASFNDIHQWFKALAETPTFRQLDQKISRVVSIGSSVRLPALVVVAGDIQKASLDIDNILRETAPR